MSIQAVAWALEQDFSYTTPKGRQTSAHGAKLVLISLANHADHVSGHCWPSSETIARESSCNVRSVYRLIAALERNGFIDVKRVRGGSGKQRSNNYWIRFDRTPGAWQFFEDEHEGDDQSDTVSCDSEATEAVENGLENATESPGQSDIGVTRQESLLEPSGLEPSVPTGFAPSARADEQAKLQAAEEAREGGLIAIIEGSDPWEAHVKAGHSRTLVGKVIVNGKERRGWYFRRRDCNGLYPKPKQTGPPVSPYMSPEDHDHI